MSISEYWKYFHRVSALFFKYNRSRTTYFRTEPKKVNHQRIVTKKWIKSKGTCNYLGEWHTHPEAVPTPSFIDVSEWKRQLRASKFDDDYLYFIIAGTQKIRVWEGNKNSLEIKLLEEYTGKRG